jgi:threonine aldolase
MTTANGHSVPPKPSNIANGTATPVSYWAAAGSNSCAAAFDFRSDTMTTPTLSMLHAIQHTTLLDDVFLEDPTTSSLEAHCAQLSGHEAGLLVMSGTMGNQVALRSHLLQPPHSVVCDQRGHIVNYEAGGISSLSQAMLIPVTPSNNHHLTLEDIQKSCIISDDVHACPTRVISLENTLNGMVMPLSEIKRISAFARANNIRMHLDGARIWEVVAADAGTLPDFCREFDSVSLCFSKGLGAPIGSIIVGNTSFITHCRRIRKSIGGGTRQAGVISAAARVAVDENFGIGPTGDGGRLRDSHQRAREIEQLWVKKGGKLAHPVETNMVWLDITDCGVSADEMAGMAAEEGIKGRGGRLVIHYQISEDAVKRLERVMDRMLAKRECKTRGMNGHA